MLLRLEVDGFKNLLGVDLRFGAFSCIAGGNGVGKSNVFDAIEFIRMLATRELRDAAASIRDSEGRRGDIPGLFYSSGTTKLDTMRLAVEMLVAKTGEDALRQQAIATSTLLRYEVVLRLRNEESESGPIEVMSESLGHITKGRASHHFLFPHSARDWRDPLVVANRRTQHGYLRTAIDDQDRRVIHISQDGQAGRSQQRLAEPLPRTVLSSLSSADSATGVIARQEMASWNILQFEPTALRNPDSFHDPTSIAPNGAHVPATLNRLLGNGRASESESAAGTRQRIVNRLVGLVQNISDLSVERDEKRELFTILATLRDGTELPARALSDGTLRFLALAVLEEASQSGLFCLEEPENGIYPDQVSSMLELLQHIAMDPHEAPDDDNALRQVIINTHSPSVVGRVPDDSLIFANPGVDLSQRHQADDPLPCVTFSALPDTWRTDKAGTRKYAKAGMAAFLDPLGDTDSDRATQSPQIKRVKDRDDLQMYLFSNHEGSKD